MRRDASLTRLIVYGCVVLALVAFTPMTRAGANIGIVLDVTGEWRLFENGRDVGKIERGQAVTSMSSVRPRSDHGRIVIHLSDDRVIRCEVGDLKGCRQPLVIRRRSSFAGRFFKAVAYLITRQPSLYEIAMARGHAEDTLGKDEHLLEAVLAFDGTKINLGAAFQKMPPGRYRLRLVPAKGEPDRLKTTAFEINWDAGTASPISASGLPPGLYRILVLDGRDEPTGSDSWVLICDAREFPRTSAKFRMAVTWADRWHGGAAHTAGRTFLRAYLDNLTQPTGK